MTLIRDRYRCTREEAIQVRERFADWEADAMPMARVLDSDDRPVLADKVLEVLDDCAHPERAEQTAKLAAETLRRCNLDARTLASALKAEGLTCPHCRQHTKNVRFVEDPRTGPSYFICRECGRSFLPAALERSD